MAKSLIRISDALQRRPEKKSTFYRQVADNILPQPVEVSGRISAWQSHEIDQSVELDIAVSALSERALARWVVSYIANQEEIYGPVGQWFSNRLEWHSKRARSSARNLPSNRDRLSDVHPSAA